MAYDKKHEKGEVRSLRVPKFVNDFLKETFTNNKNSNLTANDFVLELIETSEDYKKYIKKKLSDDNQPSLF